MLPTALQPLAQYAQFVAWKIDSGRKLPVSPITGRLASTTNPADWGTYEQAAALDMGVGFVFTERDPFFFGDVDKALVNGQWSQLAQELCARFAGAAVEVSQSGTGLHIIGRYSAPFIHKNKNTPLGLELYTKERFVALTGTHAQGSADTVHDAALAAAVQQYFNPASVDAAPQDWTVAPVPEWKGPADDMQLVERALASGSQSAASAFGEASDKVTFAELWGADAAALGAKWPGNNGSPFDASSADQALANQLAFWTGKDCARIERIMRMSALNRAKWDDRPDYLETTILKACAMVRAVYVGSTGADPAPPPPAPTLEVAVASGFELRKGAALMFHDDQMKHFAGCVYVSGPHKVLTPRGDLLNQGRFDAVLGGFEFLLAPDGKTKTTSAWEAFTQSQTYIPTRADRLCFRPEIGSGGVIEQSGIRMANTYVAVTTPSTPGDPAPYLDLVRRQLPNPADQLVLLQYMAAVVQNPGLKAQWWPVLQGVKGNGKTLHITAMVHAIGLQYCHLPNTDKMVRNGMNFNGWVEGKLFIGLEEVHGADRRGFFDGFKPTVTNRLIPIEGKGIEETTTDNRANGIITTNPVDGVPIDDDERRYAPLFCNQQRPEDLTRDGMNGAYFSDLYDWLFGRNKYAHHGEDYGLRVVNHHLSTMALPAEWLVQMTTRAPVTSSTAAAILSGRGRIEQEIMEAVEEGRPGFAGGWISSIKLDELLERRKMGVPRAKRRELLRALGYDWHPSLEGTNGRVNNVIKPDDGKPRLFCKLGSIAWSNLPDAASVAKAYTKAQTDAMTETTAAQFA